MLVLRGEFGLAKKPRSTSGCPSVNHQRRIAITNLIENTAASMYTKDCKRDAEEFIIVSSCTDGIYRYQLTKFDKFGPIYDVRRDDAAEIVKEIPNSYGLVESVK